MLAVTVGAVVLSASAFLWGLEKSRQEKESLALLSELVSLVKHIEVHIRTMRTPLPRIYEDFSSPELERTGFGVSLRTHGLTRAVEQISQKIPKDALSELTRLSRDVGNGYEKEQCELCAYTAERLSQIEERLRKNLPGKVRLYRFLPLLFVLSVIILLI